MGHVNPTSDPRGKVTGGEILYSEKKSYGLNNTVRVQLQFHIFYTRLLLIRHSLLALFVQAFPCIHEKNKQKNMNNNG